MFALRQTYLQNGFALIPNVLDAPSCDRLRRALNSAVTARGQQFLRVPSIETVIKNTTKVHDPTYERMMKRMERQKLAKQRRREVRLQLFNVRRAEAYQKLDKKLRAEGRVDLANRIRDKQRARAGLPSSASSSASSSSLTGEDILRMSQQIAEKVRVGNLAKHCDRTVDNDPQLLKAIMEHRCNVWMTNREVASFVREEATRCKLGDIAATVGGVDRPVLFADSPIARPPLGRPVYFHCSAPTIGTASLAVPHTARYKAVTLLLFPQEVSAVSLQLSVVHGSHHKVRTQLGSIRPSDLALTFLPMESHMPEMTKLFDGLGDCRVEAITNIEAGSVMVVDPCLLLSFGPNFSLVNGLVYRMHVVDVSERPSLRPHSWIQSWRSSASHIDFDSPIVFPPLY